MFHIYSSIKHVTPPGWSLSSSIFKIVLHVLSLHSSFSLAVFRFTFRFKFSLGWSWLKLWSFALASQVLAHYHIWLISFYRWIINILSDALPHLLLHLSVRQVQTSPISVTANVTNISCRSSEHIRSATLDLCRGRPAGLYRNLVLTPTDTHNCFWWPHQFTFPPATYVGPSFSTSFPTLVLFCCSYDRYSRSCEVVTWGCFWHVFHA